MDRLTAMQVFVAVVDGGSQVAAAEQLGLSRPVVSRHLAALEDWAGARLMHRTTRRLSLTPAGEQTLARCRDILALSEDLRRSVAAPAGTPQGLLRVTVSASFAQAQLAGLITRFVQLHPAVSVDLVVLDRAVNLVDERIDLALRISNDLDPNLIARRLTVCRSVVCAAPAYLQRHGMPVQPDDLARHNCLTHTYAGKSLWHFERDGVPLVVAVAGNISANEATALLQAACAGAGIAMLPTYLAAPLLRAGSLVALLPGVAPRPLQLHAVYASRRHMSPALRALLDFLAAQLGPEPSWDAPA
ncbi:MAG: LysR family transcriptional regulator [Pseudomonadota bacterium]